MKYLYVLLVLFLFVNSSTYAGVARVVNGNIAEQGEFPHMVSLRKANSHFCGGSIIHKGWVLTAAHCLEIFKAQEVAAVVGTNDLDRGGEVYQASELIVHPAYSKISLQFIGMDIGLVRLAKEIQFGPTVQPIKLSNAYVSGDMPAKFSGWGVRSSQDNTPSYQLQSLNTKTYNQLLCRIMMLPMVVPYSDVCILSPFGKGLCFGDSGSPLVSNGVQIGVASRVFPCGVGMPDICTRVSYYVPWIKRIINDKK